MAFGNKRFSAGTVWLPTGNGDTTNISPTDFGQPLNPPGNVPVNVGMGGQPGGLGLQHQGAWANRVYQRVQLDSGATAATGVGLVAANQLAYWKDKFHYIVTNDVNQVNAANGQQALTNSAFRNFVAGVFRNPVTPGYFCDVLQMGLSIGVKTTGAPAIGDQLVSDVSLTAAQAATVTAGTPAGVHVVGTVSGLTVNNVTPTDLEIQGIE
jgi:hypothetical protein